mmetsp:Transcript_23265/g.45886  ORF Transcript_23265/g.45886 Transcript_23265/m.45886 type:complete len:201 (+) Transcript_23265:34-636(+)
MGDGDYFDFHLSPNEEKDALQSASLLREIHNMIAIENEETVLVDGEPVKQGRKVVPESAQGYIEQMLRHVYDNIPSFLEQYANQFQVPLSSLVNKWKVLPSFENFYYEFAQPAELAKKLVTAMNSKGSVLYEDFEDFHKLAFEILLQPLLDHLIMRVVRPQLNALAARETMLPVPRETKSPRKSGRSTGRRSARNLPSKT